MNYLRVCPLLRKLFANSLLAAIVIGSLADLASSQRIVERSISNETRDEATVDFDAETNTTTCSDQKIWTTGNSGVSGTVGNVRTFGTGSYEVKASAFSKRKDNGQWNKAYLGAFGTGLGVTDGGETGNQETHRVDNVGRWNYIMFEFENPVIFDKVNLESVISDSDITVWIGNANNPFSNHLDLNDALLSSFGPSEDNNANNGNSRLAEVNSANRVGNVVVVAASVTDDSPDDWFKVEYLKYDCAPTQKARVEIIKEVGVPNGSGASTASFKFNATKLGVSSFNLVDNNVVGPDRHINNSITAFGSGNAITVTEEQPLGWTLADISCTENKTQNTTIDLENRSVKIIAEAGETIVCKFLNAQAQASAATASISGRAFAANGQPIEGASLTLVDLETGKTAYARTNNFGNYTFDGMEVGRFYILTISHRRYPFTDDTRSFTLNEQLDNVDFNQTY